MIVFNLITNGINQCVIVDYKLRPCDNLTLSICEA